MSSLVSNGIWWDMVSLPSQYFAGHSGPLSLAIPPWVGVTTTGNGFGHRLKRKGELYRVLCPTITTAGILAEVG